MSSVLYRVEQEVGCPQFSIGWNNKWDVLSSQYGGTISGMSSVLNTVEQELGCPHSSIRWYKKWDVLSPQKGGMKSSANPRVC